MHMGLQPPPAPPPSPPPRYGTTTIAHIHMSRTHGPLARAPPPPSLQLLADQSPIRGTGLSYSDGYTFINFETTIVEFGA
jgi:hypothetical protein